MCDVHPPNKPVRDDISELLSMSPVKDPADLEAAVIHDLDQQPDLDIFSSYQWAKLLDERRDYETPGFCYHKVLRQLWENGIITEQTYLMITDILPKWPSIHQVWRAMQSIGVYTRLTRMTPSVWHATLDFVDSTEVY